MATEMAKYVLSKHARDVMHEREISPGWINRVLAEPRKRHADRQDEQLEHYLDRIPERGNRVLRVIVNKTHKPPLVVTAYFDRTMRDKL